MFQNRLFHCNQVIRAHYLEASGDGCFEWEPTHWMPLPKSPEDKDGMD